VPKLLKKFKFTFSSASSAVPAWSARHHRPALWRINFFTAIWPLSTIVFGHFFLPIALNPNLMLFTW
jgi:hypothetical protein